VLRFDWLVLLSALGVTGMSLPYMYSASPQHFQKQLVWVALGVAAMLLMLAVDYRTLLRYAYDIYGGALALLILVLLLPQVRGARSWIALPGLGFNIQPTELMKFALVLVLAKNLMHRETQSTLRGLVAPFVLTLIPMALILKQPDLGSAILLPPLLFAVVFASGANAFHLISIALAGAASTVPMWMFVMKQYQKNRILAFLSPEKYEAREAYQLIMSLIAIGSGSLLGEGLGNGTLTELDLLPDKHTDFIFGVIAEEGGFVAVGILISLYLLLMLGGFRVASARKEPGGRLIATGCAALLGSQALVNIGVVTALLPTTGITLPLVSYGGSSMIISFCLIGLLLNVGASQPLVLARESFTGKRLIDY
jgi:rod shape determining protein RodA